MKREAPRTNKTVPELSEWFGYSNPREAGWSSSFNRGSMMKSVGIGEFRDKASQFLKMRLT